ncbi:DUF6053 domain-containing protein [Lysobacter enzymogenes]|uniref:DUF6053 domain-containing protein n=1 Tax=Lysobacter enzymogenes TaxID=69 RepID=UPI00339A2BDD
MLSCRIAARVDSQRSAKKHRCAKPSRSRQRLWLFVGTASAQRLSARFAALRNKSVGTEVPATTAAAA